MTMQKIYQRYRKMYEKLEKGINKKSANNKILNSEI